MQGLVFIWAGKEKGVGGLERGEGWKKGGRGERGDNREGGRGKRGGKRGGGYFFIIFTIPVSASKNLEICGALYSLQSQK